MNEAVLDMFGKYSINSSKDAENALKEIIQEITLLGLHRANFFEKAAFYGGTALRILYGLSRYSEDLDFTLFESNKKFSLESYFAAVKTELKSYGFDVKIESINKAIPSPIESAFIKANTKIHLLKIQNIKPLGKHVQENSKLQIKFEVDTDPCLAFDYETKYLLEPTSFPIICLKKPDLFAGKIHALLFRKWKNRVKGRDFYDFVWYLKNQIPVKLNYLNAKSIQSGHIKFLGFNSVKDLQIALNKKFESVDFEKAKSDVLPFIKNPNEINYWSVDYFKQLTENIKAI